MNVKNISSISLACTVLTGAMYVTPVAAAEKVDIVLNSFFPARNFLNTKVFPRWTREIEQATEGRVSITIPSKSVAPPPKQLEAVTSGLVDATYTFNGFLPSDLQAPLVAHLPWMTSDSAEKMSTSLWNTYERNIAAKSPYGQDLVVLSLFVGSPAEFFSISDKQFSKMEDLTSAKIWALPGTTAKVLGNAGVSIVSGPAVKVHEYVSHGVVDAFVGIPFSDAESFKAASYVTSVTKFETPLFAPSFTLLIRKDKWEQISESDRDAIKKLSGAHFASLAGEQYDKANRKSQQNLDKAGVTYVEATPEMTDSLKTASESVLASWKTTVTQQGYDADKIISDYQSGLN